MPRSRNDWNDRLNHWQRPASESEEVKIDRAARLVRNAIALNPWLASEGVTVHAQGSYHNNTNVRLDSDMDLRVVHPGLKVNYHSNVHVPSANQILNYEDTGRSLITLNARMRSEVAKSLRTEFGFGNVDEEGSRAIHARELPGSHAEIDVVPTFVLNNVVWIDVANNYKTSEGVAILSRDASTWTFNFPQQHYDNGVAKTVRTGRRFKRTVRMLKKLKSEMAENGHIPTECVPSYLIECLAYGVDDSIYLNDWDDSYALLRGVLRRLEELTRDPYWALSTTEINEVKGLFGAWQTWTSADVTTFLNAARSHTTIT